MFIFRIIAVNLIYKKEKKIKSKDQESVNQHTYKSQFSFRVISKPFTLNLDLI